MGESLNPGHPITWANRVTGEVIAEDVVLFVPLDIEVPVKFQKMKALHPDEAVLIATVEPEDMFPAGGVKVGVAAVRVLNPASKNRLFCAWTEAQNMTRPMMVLAYIRIAIHSIVGNADAVHHVGGRSRGKEC